MEAAPAPTDRLLMLSDAPHAEHELLEEVKNVEDWATNTPRAEDLELEDLMLFLNVTLEQNVIELRDKDQERYLDELLAEVGRSWRTLALRLHPDKARGRDSSFWNDERYHRLKAAFQYANNVQEALKNGLMSWIVKGIEDVRMDYRLTGRGKNLILQILFPPHEAYETIVRFVGGRGKPLELVLDPGVSKLQFYELRQPKVFADSFGGFTLSHRAAFGPATGNESCPLLARRPVPDEVRPARGAKTRAAPKRRAAPKKKAAPMKRAAPKRRAAPKTRAAPKRRPTTKRRRAPKKPQAAAKRQRRRV